MSSIQPGDWVRIIGQHASESSFEVIAVTGIDAVAVIRYPAGLGTFCEYTRNLVKQ